MFGKLCTIATHRVRAVMLDTGLQPYTDIADLFIVDPDGFIIRFSTSPSFYIHCDHYDHKIKIIIVRESLHCQYKAISTTIQNMNPFFFIWDGSNISVNEVTFVSVAAKLKLISRLECCIISEIRGKH